tara:strand:+ start:248 stop:397 length:150 start_codon:yes stop_codon:yes gene_type:complete
LVFPALSVLIALPLVLDFESATAVLQTGQKAALKITADCSSYQSYVNDL